MHPFTLPASCLATIPRQWADLHAQVGGRLYPSVPFAKPCYDDFNSTACATIRDNYLEEVFRSNTPTAFIQSQWESCQTSEEHCLLNWQNPHNSTHPSANACKPGSLPQYHIDVQTADDVKAAFDFSRRTKAPLSIRNTGHDYKGRSSAPGSLGLWLHNLQDISYEPNFVPEGCNPHEVEGRVAVTMGAGVQWNEAHIFADEHNVTLVGGSDKSVGAVGGWLQGGGHSALSNTMGLGADRVLQFKIVTPTGTLLTTNACSHPDLFWALRGGGGGTFGVVLEATMLASPRLSLRTVILSWNAPPSSEHHNDAEKATILKETKENRTKAAWTHFVDSSVELAKEGWGGYVTADVAVLINPLPLHPGSTSKISQLIHFVERLKHQEGGEGVVVVQRTFDSWLSFFNVFTSRFVASVGKSLAISSRLVPRTTFSTPRSRSGLIDALLDANRITTKPGVIILFTAPSSTPDGSLTPLPSSYSSPSSFNNITGGAAYQRQTSVHPAWRSSLYHVTNIEPWALGSSPAQIAQAYRTVRRSFDGLRKVIKESGGEEAAYGNEADVYERGDREDGEDGALWQRVFWGDNYERLLEVKRKYDPEDLLDCWHCVGFKRTSERFGCYLDV